MDSTIPAAIEEASTTSAGRARFGSAIRQWRRVRWQSRLDALVLYSAYGSNGMGVLEGRVIDEQLAKPPAATDRRHTNLRRNLHLLINKERKHFPVTACMYDRVWHTTTDSEGFFRIGLEELGALTDGWHLIHVYAGQANASIRLLLVPRENIHGVISDFDDTIMITEVTHTRRMLANTLLRNPLQRRVVPGMAALFEALAARNPYPAAPPLFYLSASPRQLHMPLQAVLDHNGFPPGVLVTKRVTNGATREPLRDQRKYKLAKIEEILARVPNVRFTLIGDDGERDPEIFAELRDRYPERIEAAWIRHVHPNPNRPRLPEQGNLDDLLAASGLR